MFMKDFTRTTTAAAVVSAAPVRSGLAAGTLVETGSGWHPVEALRMGDRVQTLDGGLARILGLHRTVMQATGFFMAVPGGLIDNCSDLALLPDQHLLLDTGSDPAFPDDLFVLVPALALDGIGGTVRRRLTRPMEVLTPMFAGEEAVYASSGTLLHCPGIGDPEGTPAAGFFTRLDMLEARAYLSRRLAAHATAPARA